jgi:hypothetical protein
MDDDKVILGYSGYGSLNVNTDQWALATRKVHADHQAKIADSELWLACKESLYLYYSLLRAAEAWYGNAEPLRPDVK